MDSSEREPIYVFKVDDAYLFTHYFARTDVFSEPSFSLVVLPSAVGK